MIFLRKRYLKFFCSLRSYRNLFTKKLCLNESKGHKEGGHATLQGLSTSRKRQIYRFTLNSLSDHFQICFIMPTCVQSSYSTLKQYINNSPCLIIQPPYQVN